MPHTIEAVEIRTEQRRPVAKAVGGVLFGVWLQLFLRRRFNQHDELELEHPKWILGSAPRTERLEDLASRVSAEIPDDAEAIAAIRAAADGKPRDWKIAAASMRQNPYTWEHRKGLRAARLLKAAADGSRLVPPTAAQEALFAAVERLEAVPLAEAFALLASEVPALRALEQQVVDSLTAPGWEDRDADDRLGEIRAQLAPLVGPDAQAGSSLIRSHAANNHAGGHLLRKAGLLSEDNWGR